MGSVSWVTQMAHPPVVDVRTFGAKGDGTTDDTAAIAAAIASLPPAAPSTGYSSFITYNTGGGIVYMPPGIYRASIVVPASVQLVGAGEATTIKATGSGLSVVATLPSSNRVKIKNLTIDVDNKANVIGLDVNSCMDGQFKWVKITGGQAGLYTGSGLKVRTTVGNSSSVNNKFDHIHVEISGGSALVMDGTDYLIGPVVALNTFSHLRLSSAGTSLISPGVYGGPVIDLVKATDTNFFYRTDISASCNIGITFNSSNPTAETGVGAFYFTDTTFESITSTCIVFAKTTSNLFRGTRRSGSSPNLYSQTADSRACITKDDMHALGDSFIAPSFAGSYPFLIGTPGAGTSIVVSPNPITLTNGLNSNIAVTAGNNVIVGPSAAFQIGGFAMGFGGPFDGQELTVFSNLAQTVTIIDQSASSSAGNKVLTLTGADVVGRVNGKGIWHFKYYAAIGGFWVLESYN